jgi:acyl carrier protein
VTGVVHSAATIDDATLAHQDDARLAGVLAPKAGGAWHLHEATLQDPIELFVLFSAAGPVIDAKAQANYAAANAFVDALAVHRRGLGLPAVSVQWGPWQDAGMAARLDDSMRERWSRRGLDWWTGENSVAAFDALLGETPPQVLAIRLSARQPTRMQVAAARVGGALRAQLESAAPAARSALMIDHVSSAISGVLGLDAAPAVTTPLRDAGLDSLSAIELRNALAQSAGLPLPATLAFDHPTITAIAAFVLREMKLDDGSNAGSAVPVMKAAAPHEDVIRSNVEELSDEEAEALLMQELGFGSTEAH